MDDDTKIVPPRLPPALGFDLASPAEPSPPTRPWIAYASGPSRGGRRWQIRLGIAAVVGACIAMLLSGAMAIGFGSATARVYRRVSLPGFEGEQRGPLTSVEIDQVVNTLLAGHLTAGQAHTLRQRLADPHQNLLSPVWVSIAAPLAWTPQGGYRHARFGDWVSQDIVLDAQGRLQRIDFLDWRTGQQTSTMFGLDGGSSSLTANRYRMAAATGVVAGLATALLAALNFVLAIVLLLAGVLLLMGRPAGRRYLRRYALLQIPAAILLSTATVFLACSTSVASAPVIQVKEFLWLLPGVAGSAWGVLMLEAARRGE